MHNPILEIDALARALDIDIAQIRHTVLAASYDFDTAAREISFAYKIPATSCLLITHCDFVSKPNGAGGVGNYNLRSDFLYFGGLELSFVQNNTQQQLKLDAHIFRAPVFLAFGGGSQLNVHLTYAPPSDATAMSLLARFTGYVLPVEALKTLSRMATVFEEAQPTNVIAT